MLHTNLSSAPRINPAWCDSVGDCPYPENGSSLSTLTTETQRYNVAVIIKLLSPVIIPFILILLSKFMWQEYIITTSDHLISKPLPPGSMGFPIIGETLQFLIQGLNFNKIRRNKHGNVFKTHIFGRPTIRAIGAGNVRKILQGENTLVISELPASARLLLGDGSLSQTTGKCHLRRKKAIIKAFTYTALSSYVPTIQRIVRSYIGNWCNRRQLLACPEIKILTFDVTCKVLAGFDIDEKECHRLETVFETFISGLFSLSVKIPLLGMRKALRARDELLHKIGECIQKKRESEDLAHASDALSYLMEVDGPDKLSLTELQETCLELLFAGHETTASAASFLMMQLGKREDLKSRIKNELAENGVHDSIHGNDLDFETISRLHTVKNVVKEVLRLSPPVGSGFRKVIQTFELEGFQIPKGWKVAYSIRDTHEMSHTFDSPDDFDPDHWNSVVDDRYEFLPFGGGKRMCPGKELAMLFLKIFAIELSRCSTWTLQNETTSFRSFPIPFPADDLPIKFLGSSEKFRGRLCTV
ncbi:hypothetical protein ACJMK2_006760 [Sinanodonta woodiana]|uniref:Cytochrome P450 n=1 Tax=Sinanodonta woodiana TaxID=1069815 RepID=A0ABD3VU54_SINWO